MKLEYQVCSLELAKHLKELGVKQESEFYYVPIKMIQHSKYYTEKLENDVWLIAHVSQLSKSEHIFSAFTVAEIEEMFPVPIVIDKGKLSNTFWTSQYDSNKANVHAKMLIYLLENKLIEYVFFRCRNS